jgi:hypothetical protein
MVPRPVVETDQDALSDLLFRPPVEDTSEAGEMASARIDDLVFAWPAQGLPKLPGAEEPTGPTEVQPEPEPDPDAPADERPEPAEGDDRPRPDLDFL